MHLKTIFKNKTTRRALIFTLGIFVIFSLGNYLVSPGINPNFVAETTGTALDGLFATLSLYGGGNISQLALFALGLGPYITASIIIQILESDLVPRLSDWKNQGEEGSKKRSNATKILAIFIALAQAASFIALFTSQPQLTPIIIGSSANIILAVLAMTAGTFTLVWLGDRITENGVGNGISVLIMAGIVSSIPATLYQIYTTAFQGYFNPVEGTDAISQSEFIESASIWGIILVIQILLILVVIAFNLAKRKIRINYVRSSRGKSRESSYLPIKVNPAGVIPVIFVQPIMQIPIFILDALPLFSDNGVGPYETVVRALFDLNSTYWYVSIIVYMLIIIAFSILYSLVQMNPETVAENLERQNAYIVGVRSGEDTESYLGQVITKTSLWGGIMLAIIAAIPIVITNVTGVGVQLGLLGTGLIIAVSVMTQAYEGLLTKTEKSKYRKIFGDVK